MPVGPTVVATAYSKAPCNHAGIGPWRITRRSYPGSGAWSGRLRRGAGPRQQQPGAPPIGDLAAVGTAEPAACRRGPDLPSDVRSVGSTIDLAAHPAANRRRTQEPAQHAGAAAQDRRRAVDQEAGDPL